MILTHCTHETVLHIALNMRERDKEEIYGLRYEANPFHIVNDVMAQANFAWVGWWDGKPCAVGGGAPIHPGVWSVFMFATDDFPHIGLPATRFVRKTVLPAVFELGAHRLQCDSRSNHVDAHRWLEAAGFRRESVRQGFGKDGADYFHFVKLASEMSILDKSDKSC